MSSNQSLPADLNPAALLRHAPRAGILDVDGTRVLFYLTKTGGYDTYGLSAETLLKMLGLSPKGLITHEQLLQLPSVASVSVHPDCHSDTAPLLEVQLNLRQDPAALKRAQDHWDAFKQKVDPLLNDVEPILLQEYSPKQFKRIESLYPSGGYGLKYGNSIEFTVAPDLHDEHYVKVYERFSRSTHIQARDVLRGWLRRNDLSLSGYCML